VDMIPCSYCEKHDKKCVVAEESKKCSECVSKGRKCDVVGPSPRDWQSLEAEERRLEEEALRSAARIAEESARLTRLHKQQKQLRSRAKDMLRRGLKTLDELDEAERKEREEQERVRAEQAATAAPGPVLYHYDPNLEDWSGFVGFVDETHSQAQNS